MKKNKLKLKKNGFTLVELLVVISIIGILTIIVSSGFITSREKSRDVSRKSELKSLSDALNMYYADNGLFPTSLTFGGEFVDNTNPNNEIIYMKKIPSEGSVGISQLKYEVLTTRKSFRLYTNLENEEDSDCLTQEQCPTFEFDKGCCYVVTSSNIGKTEDLL